MLRKRRAIKKYSKNSEQMWVICARSPAAPIFTPFSLKNQDQIMRL